MNELELPFFVNTDSDGPLFSEYDGDTRWHHHAMAASRETLSELRSAALPLIRDDDASSMLTLAQRVVPLSCRWDPEGAAEWLRSVEADLPAAQMALTVGCIAACSLDGYPPLGLGALYEWLGEPAKGAVFPRNSLLTADTVHVDYFERYASETVTWYGNNVFMAEGPELTRMSASLESVEIELHDEALVAHYFPSLRVPARDMRAAAILVEHCRARLNDLAANCRLLAATDQALLAWDMKI